MQGNALSDRLDEILREEENRIEGVEGLEADDLAPGGGEGGAEGDASSVGSGVVEEKDGAGRTPVPGVARRKNFLKFRGVSMDTGVAPTGTSGAGGLMGMDDDLDAMPASESQMDLMSRNSSTEVLAQQMTKRSSGLRVLTEGVCLFVSFPGPFLCLLISFPLSFSRRHYCDGAPNRRVKGARVARCDEAPLPETRGAAVRAPRRQWGQQRWGERRGGCVSRRRHAPDADAYQNEIVDSFRRLARLARKVLSRRPGAGRRPR